MKLEISDLVEMLKMTAVCPECGHNESLFSILNTERFAFNPAVAFICQGKYDPLGRRESYSWKVLMSDLEADAKELLEMEKK